MDNKKNAVGEGFPEAQLSTYLIAGLFAYFVFRLVFLAFRVSFHVPPDETTWIGMCELFSRSFRPPAESEASYALGMVTHRPYLYYFLMGRLWNLNMLPIDNFLFLRLWNCLFSLLSVVYGYKWLKLITDKRIVHVLFVVLITNTPMFTFTGFAVNYDNLNTLFSILSLFYLHVYFQKHQLKELLLFWCVLLGGALTKTSFLPLFFILSVIFFIREGLRVKEIFPDFKKTISFTKPKPSETGLFIVCVLLLVLNIFLYGKNIICYGHIEPKFYQVLTEDQFMKNRLYAQAWIVSQYRTEQVTFEEAVEKAKQINHPGDRADAFSMLEQQRANKQNPIPRYNRLQYAEVWLNIMLERTVGIAAHLLLMKGGGMVGIYKLLLFFSLIFFIRFYSPKSDPPYLTDASVTVLFYMLILMQFVNYNVYFNTFMLGKAVTGRYLFPVLVPFYGLMTYYVILHLHRRVALTLALIVSCYFIYGDFPYFLMNTDPRWFF